MDEKIAKLYESLSQETTRFVGQVIQIEKAKLHQHPHNINNELLQALKEIVK